MELVGFPLGRLRLEGGLMELGRADLCRTDEEADCRQGMNARYLAEFLSRYPEIELDFHLTDNFVDIIRDGFDLAIRIGELPVVNAAGELDDPILRAEMAAFDTDVFAYRAMGERFMDMWKTGRAHPARSIFSISAGNSTSRCTNPASSAQPAMRLESPAPIG